MKQPLLILVLALLSGAAAAQLPALQESGNIQWVTGGVGEDERAAFDEARKAFNLELVFAAKAGGAYVADVDVLVTDKAGRKMLEARTDGPRLLARLPAGTYKVAATFGSHTQTRTVTVPAKGTKQLAMYWADPTVAQEGGPVREPASQGASRP